MKQMKPHFKAQFSGAPSRERRVDPGDVVAKEWDDLDECDREILILLGLKRMTALKMGGEG